MRSFRRFIHIAVFSLATLASVHVHADEKALDALLNQRRRPTMSQVYRAMDGNLSRNPFSAQVKAGSWFQGHITSIDSLAQVIAFMEKAFPGATWAPLGRDAVIFGDLLDGFYLSIGEEGRVARLNASTQSFRQNGDRARLRFLRAAGLKIEDLPHRAPFVGLDRTHFGTGSQSTNLIRAVYQAYAKRGGNPEELVKKVNFLGLDKFMPGPQLDNQMIETYFSRNNMTGETLSEIMQIPIAGWTDSDAWHDTFGRLWPTWQMGYEGRPGTISDLGTRKLIVGEMIEIFRRVSRPGFLAAVRAEAKNLSYEFPVSEEGYRRFREVTLETEKKEELDQVVRARELREYFAPQVISSLNDLVAKLPPFQNEDHKSYFSQNGAALAAWLEKMLARRAALAENLPDETKNLHKYTVQLEFIDRISSLYHGKWITRRDYRRLLAKALNINDPDSEFFESFIKLYEKYPLLQMTLEQKNRFFMTSHKEGTERTRWVLRAIEQRVTKTPAFCAQSYLEPDNEQD